MALYIIYICFMYSLLSQLSTRRISQFPAILTKKRACDVSVVACLRDRTLGNSSTALYNRVQEQHTEEWMKRAVMYYADCEEYRSVQS